MLELFKEYESWLKYGNIEAPYSEHTISLYLRENRQFLEYLAKLEVSDGNDVVLPIIKSYFIVMGKNNKVSTIKTKIAAIDSFFDWMYLEGHIENNPVGIYKKQTRKRGRGARQEKRLIPVLKEFEIDKIFETMDADSGGHQLRNKALIGFLLDTGVRASELAQVTRYQAESMLKSDKIEIIGKGNKERTITPLNHYDELLERFLEQSDIGLYNPVFTTQKGEVFGQRSLHHLVSGLLERSGIKKPQNGAHLLRHTAASLMLKEWKVTRLVQLNMGHESIQTTERYTHLI